MKTLFKLILGFILILGFSSCEEDEPVVVPTTTKYKVTVSTNKGGEVTPSISFVEEGKSLTLKIQPYFGYEIEKLNLDGQNVVCSGSDCFTLSNVKKDHFVEVSFKENLKGKILGRWRMDSLNIYNWNTRNWEYHKIYNVPNEDQYVLWLMPDNVAFVGYPGHFSGWKWDIDTKGKFVLWEDKYEILKLTTDTLVIGQKETCREVYFKEYISGL
jgi:hypothetical protein